MWLTWANGLTLLRLLAAPAFALAILDGRSALASVLFTAAVASDFADGWLARRLGEETPFGGLFDHAVDATFVAAGAAALASLGVLPPWLPPLIALAFLQYAVDSRWQGGRQEGPGGAEPVARGLAGSRLGRWNGIAYYVIVAVPVVRDALGLSWPPAVLVSAGGWLLVGSTVASMGDRLKRVWRSRRAPGSPA